MKATRFYRNFLLPMAFAALAAACSTDEQPLAPQEITLTTPVLTLADATAQAAVSRAGEGTVPLEEVSKISLIPHLTKGLGTEKVKNLGIYTYSDSKNWSASGSRTITNGPGAYYAAAQGKVNLKARSELHPFINELCYTWQGSMLVSEDGTFVLDGAMTPVTAAIWVKLKDANGNDITDANGLGNYNIHYTGVKSSFSPSYKKLIDGSYDYVLNANNGVGTYSATVSYGFWLPTTYGTAGSSWELFTINFHEGPDAESSVLASYPVYYTGQLTLEAGKFYTFTVQLNGDKEATIVGNVTVGNFTTGKEINIER